MYPCQLETFPLLSGTVTGSLLQAALQLLVTVLTWFQVMTTGQEATHGTITWLLRWPRSQVDHTQLIRCITTLGNVMTYLNH